MKTAIVLILSVLAQAVGNTFLSKAMKAIGEGSAASGEGFSVTILFHALQEPMIWIGILLLIAFFALFSAALSWVDLSFALPATSFERILTVALAYFFLNEHVSPIRWIGTIFICLGVVLVSRSGASRTDVRTEEE